MKGSSVSIARVHLKIWICW